MTRHQSKKELLRHLDGEQTKSAMRTTAEHLQACWLCQTEFGRLKEHIAAILEAQTAVFGPSVPPPPRPWPPLEPRLDRAMRLNAVPFWRKLVPFTGAAMKLQLAYGFAALALTVAGFSIWFSAPASAKEVLQRTAAADARRQAITGQQVIRQRVRVKTRNRHTSSEHAGRLESWKSIRSRYWNTAGDPVNAHLLELCKAYGAAADLPLSPPAIESWVKTAGAEPRVAHHDDSIVVLAVSNPQGQARGLEEVRFHVQRGNWHLDEMTLSFTDATYQITEEESSMVTLSEVPLDVLASLELLESAGVGAAISPQRPVAPSAIASPVNLDDLEMTVRYELHGVGADLGEGIEVSPRPPDRLLVDARQASATIKERLVRLLANKPGIQLELDAPNGSGGGVSRTIPPQATSMAPADRRLQMFFGGAEAQENYTRSVLEAGNKVLAQLYALGNLARRWPPDQESRLSAGSRLRLDAMVRDHTRETRLSASRLEEQLEPLLKNFGYAVSNNFPAQAGATWQEAGASGLEAARRADRILRALLTASDAPISPDDALPQLRRSLHDLERAARALPESQPR